MVKYFNEFKKHLEAANGTDMIGKYELGVVPHVPSSLSAEDTDIIADTSGNVYSQNEYQDLYFDYLKRGGTPLNGFTQENLLKVLGY